MELLETRSELAWNCVELLIQVRSSEGGPHQCEAHHCEAHQAGDGGARLWTLQQDLTGARAGKARSARGERLRDDRHPVLEEYRTIRHSTLFFRRSYCLPDTLRLGGSVVTAADAPPATGTSTSPAIAAAVVACPATAAAAATDAAAMGRLSGEFEKIIEAKCPGARRRTNLFRLRLRRTCKKGSTQHPFLMAGVPALQ